MHDRHIAGTKVAFRKMARGEQNNSLKLKISVALEHHVSPLGQDIVTKTLYNILKDNMVWQFRHERTPQYYTAT